MLLAGAAIGLLFGRAGAVAALTLGPLAALAAMQAGIFFALDSVRLSGFALPVALLGLQAAAIGPVGGWCAGVLAAAVDGLEARRRVALGAALRQAGAPRRLRALALAGAAVAASAAALSLGLVAPVIAFALEPRPRLILFALLLAFIAVSHLLARFGAVFGVVAVEGGGGVRGLRRAAALSAGRRWAATGASMLMLVIALIAGLLALLLAQLGAEAAASALQARLSGDDRVVIGMAAAVPAATLSLAAFLALYWRRLATLADGATRKEMLAAFE